MTHRTMRCRLLLGGLLLVLFHVGCMKRLIAFSYEIIECARYLERTESISCVL